MAPLAPLTALMANGLWLMVEKDEEDKRDENDNDWHPLHFALSFKL
jgi:hypothetical protein